MTKPTRANTARSTVKERSCEAAIRFRNGWKEIIDDIIVYVYRSRCASKWAGRTSEGCACRGCEIRNFWNIGGVRRVELAILTDSLFNAFVERHGVGTLLSQIAGDESVPLPQGIRGKARGLKGEWDRWVTDNMGLVYACAKKMAPQGAGGHVKNDDLIQEGALGLMWGLFRYDPFMLNSETRRPYAVSTFAYPWIRHYMLRCFQNVSRAIRIPVHQLENQRQLLSASEALITRHGREPTEEELVNLILERQKRQRARTKARKGKAHAKPSSTIEQVSAKIKSAMKIPEEPVPMQTKAFGHGLTDATELKDLIATQPDIDGDPIRNLEEAERQLITRRLIEKLRPDEIYVLTHRYGLVDGRKHKLTEIGEILHISRQRVEQIEKKAIDRLRRHALNEGFDDTNI